MDYHLFWILYALVTGGTYYVANADDCAKLGQVTKEETQFIGLTCYVKRGERWIPALRAEYEDKKR